MNVLIYTSDAAGFALELGAESGFQFGCQYWAFVTNDGIVIQGKLAQGYKTLMSTTGAPVAGLEGLSFPVEMNTPLILRLDSQAQQITFMQKNSVPGAQGWIYPRNAGVTLPSRPAPPVEQPAGKQPSKTAPTTADLPLCVPGNQTVVLEPMVNPPLFRLTLYMTSAIGSTEANWVAQSTPTKPENSVFRWGTANRSGAEWKLMGPDGQFGSLGAAGFKMGDTVPFTATGVTGAANSLMVKSVDTLSAKSAMKSNSMAVVA